VTGWVEKEDRTTAVARGRGGDRQCCAPRRAGGRQTQKSSGTRRRVPGVPANQCAAPCSTLLDEAVSAMPSAGSHQNRIRQERAPRAASDSAALAGSGTNAHGSVSGRERERGA
jgi:hypothetical protein